MFYQGLVVHYEKLVVHKKAARTVLAEGIC
jgi:hypothetical protein